MLMTVSRANAGTEAVIKYGIGIGIYIGFSRLLVSVYTKPMLRRDLGIIE